MEIFACVGQCNIIDAVFNFAAIAVVLTFNTRSVLSTFSGTRLINTADRVGMRMFIRDEPLTLIAKKRFIPDNRF